MSKTRALSEHLSSLAPDEQFGFSCHPGVPCFGDCCADLDCELHPYDVLRLRRALDLSSAELLAQHAEVGVAHGTGFPQVFLSMRSDAQRTCPIVQNGACTVYEDRPGACRCYPVGRGARLDESGRVQVEHVLVQEAHCRGFTGAETWTATTWLADQSMNDYVRLNDRHMRLVARWLEERRPLTRGQHGLVLLALYRLDALRERLHGGAWPEGSPIEGGEEWIGDETQLLLRAFDWVEEVLMRRAASSRRAETS